MCQAVLQDPAFFEFLLHIDQDHAASVRAPGCAFCSGPLHAGDFTRKPQGGPGSALVDLIRISFCCGHCRLRCTPASVRFLGRRVYWGSLIGILLAHAEVIGELSEDAMTHAINSPKGKAIEALFSHALRV